MGLDRSHHQVLGSIKVLAIGWWRLCEPKKILPDQINLGRKPLERLSGSGQVGIFRGHFQLVRGVLRGRGLKGSNRTLESVSRPLDHNRVACIKTISDLAFLLCAVCKP